MRVGPLTAAPVAVEDPQCFGVDFALPGKREGEEFRVGALDAADGARWQCGLLREVLVGSGFEVCVVLLRPGAFAKNALVTFSRWKGNGFTRVLWAGWCCVWDFVDSVSCLGWLRFGCLFGT